MCLSFTNHRFEVSFVKLILFLVFFYLFALHILFHMTYFLFSLTTFHGTHHTMFEMYAYRKFVVMKNNRFNIVGSWRNTITSDDFSASNKIVFHSIYNLTYDEHLKSTLGEIEFSWRITNEDNTFTFHDHTNRFKVFMFYWELQSS